MPKHRLSAAPNFLEAIVKSLGDSFSLVVLLKLHVHCEEHRAPGKTQTEHDLLKLICETCSRRKGLGDQSRFPVLMQAI